jgi:adenosylmethionine-8-amino-7-oxononanoate aminotransferase
LFFYSFDDSLRQVLGKSDDIVLGIVVREGYRRFAVAERDPKFSLHAKIKVEAFARGLIVYPMGGTVDGQHGDHILIAPPFIIEEAEFDLLVERLADAVNAATGSA